MNRFVLTSVLLLAGCSTNAPMWSRQGATEQTFSDEVRQCTSQARISAAAVDGPLEPYNATEATRAFHRCMRDRGWAFTEVDWSGKPAGAFKADDDTCSKMSHRGPAWLECMQTAGWRLSR
jgi:hypothetical protein